MKQTLAIFASALALALVMLAPSKASAGGYYSGYRTTCCCVTYCYGYVRGGAYGRYAYPGYAYNYRYQRYAYPRARGYTRRQLRREAIRGW